MTDDPRSTHDPTTAVPRTPLGATAPPPTEVAGPPRGRARWFAALGLIALIVAVTAIATLYLTESSPPSTVAGYVPADSVAFGELRLDLPGDQRQEVGEFLSKFPGFADQAALDTKLDEVLDRLLSETTDGKQTYTRDIKPWFDGEMAFSMGPLPTDVGALEDPDAAMGRTRALLLLSVKDEALARAWFTKTLSESGASSTAETYNGTALTVFTDPDHPQAQAAFGLVGGKVAIAGDLASVKAAIDTGGAGAMASGEQFAAARAAMAGDDLGFMFVDMESIVDAALQLTESSGSTPPMNDALVALVPDWAAFRLRVEGDALLMDGVMPHVDAAPGPAANHANGVAAHAPPSTIALAAGNDYGATLLETIALYRQDPAMADAFREVDRVAGIVGGLEGALGWMGDTGVVIARTGDAVEGGIISVPADAAAGRQLLTTLRSFAALGGAQLGITTRDEEHNGTTITIIDLGTAEDLASLAVLFGGMPIPDDAASGLPEGHIEISYAATDGVVVIGSGPDFVKHVIDTGAGQSLADDARYAGLVGRVGADHTGVTFVDIAAIREFAERSLVDAPAEKRAEYEESIKPFLTPFDAFVAASVTGVDLDQQHAIVTVK